MNWDALPVDEIRREIRIEKNPEVAFQNVVNYGRQSFASRIWDEFQTMDVKNDIELAQVWL